MIAKSHEKEEILLGIDYGVANIGLAFGRNGLTSPIKVISAKDKQAAIAYISKFVIINNVTKIVFGLPLDFEGKESSLARDARHFANLLKLRVRKPVDFMSEYGTSKDSLQDAVDLGVSMKNRKKIDHLSAALILKDYYGKTLFL